MTPSTFYLDASALVKRYMAEQGTEWVEALCKDEENNAIAIAHIGLVEVAAAFAAKRRGHFIADNEHQRALNDLITDAQSRYQLVSINPDITDSAIQLTGRRKLRGYDAVHLACALALNRPLIENEMSALIFVSADADLLDAAQAENLPTENPNDY